MKKGGYEAALLNFVLSQHNGSSGGGGFARSGGSFRHGETITNLATLRGGTGFALGALLRGFVGTEAAHFLKDAVHFEACLEALERTVNGFAFADLNFGHKSVVGGGGKRGAKVGAGWRASTGM